MYRRRFCKQILAINQCVVRSLHSGKGNHVWTLQHVQDLKYVHTFPGFFYLGFQLLHRSMVQTKQLHTVAYVCTCVYYSCSSLQVFFSPQRISLVRHSGKTNEKNGANGKCQTSSILLVENGQTFCEYQGCFAKCCGIVPLFFSPRCSQNHLDIAENSKYVFFFLFF